VDNWLPGVETMGDLLEVCGMVIYGLSEGEIEEKIFSHRTTYLRLGRRITRINTDDAM